MTKKKKKKANVKSPVSKPHPSLANDSFSSRLEVLETKLVMCPSYFPCSSRPSSITSSRLLVASPTCFVSKGKNLLHRPCFSKSYH